MKTYSKLLAAFMFLAAVSCSQELDKILTEKSSHIIDCKSFYAVMPEFKSGGDVDTRASLESVVRINWAAGDKLVVFNLTTGKQLGGSLVAENAGSKACFVPTGLSGTVSQGDKLVFFYDADTDISLVEETDFSPMTVDLSEQNGGQDNVPIVAYAEYTVHDDGIIEAEDIDFTFLVSYMQLALSALPASTTITALEVNNVNSSAEFTIENGEFVFHKTKGKIKLIDSFNANTKGANVRYFSMYASEAEVSARQASITANGQEHETAWVKGGFNAGYYYQSVATGFANENIQFVDNAFKSYCVSHFDGNNDGEVSFAEAAAITEYPEFTSVEKAAITSVYELAYFPASLGIPSFQGCTSLKHINLPGTLNVIPDYTFKDCTSMQEINIPDNVSTIGRGAFEGCTSLQYFSGKMASDDHQFLINENCLVAFAPSTHDFVSIPTIEIMDGVFKNCTNIKSVNLNDVQVIGEEAFMGCTALPSLNVVSSVSSIGDRSFKGCSKLERVYSMAECPAELGNNVFDDCNDGLLIFVSEINKNNYDTSTWSQYDVRSRVWNQIFYTTTDGQKLEIDETWASANNTPWWQDGTLSLLSNEYVDGRGVLTFSGDIISVKSEWVSDDINYNNGAYHEYCSITGTGFTTMFTGQERLESVTFPDCMNQIPNMRGCVNLKTLNIPEAVDNSMGINYQTPFESCTKIESFTGSHVSSDGKYVIFDDCIVRAAKVLPEELTIPSYVNKIGDLAFNESMTLRTVIINDNIKSIGLQAFRGSMVEEYVLTSMTPPETIEGGGPFWFKDDGAGFIYVPEQAVDTYKTAGGSWYEYVDLIVGN